jgi:serine/threonine protein kinase
VEDTEQGDRVAEEGGLPQAPRNWSCGELIGAGAFGRVYLGLNNDNGELVAVKQVPTSPRGAGQVQNKMRSCEIRVGKVLPKIPFLAISTGMSEHSSSLWRAPWG